MVAYCTDCGTKTEAGQAYCGGCGKALSGTTAAQGDAPRKSQWGLWLSALALAAVAGVAGVVLSDRWSGDTATDTAAPPPASGAPTETAAATPAPTVQGATNAAASPTTGGTRFDGYPAPAFTGRPAPLQLTGAAANYRTVLSDAYNSSPDFNGSMVIAQIGCGTGCRSAYALDQRTGRAYPFPLGGEEYPYIQYEYRPNSALFWASYPERDAGAPGPKLCIAEAYHFTNGGFTRVTQTTVENCDN